MRKRGSHKRTSGQGKQHDLDPRQAQNGISYLSLPPEVRNVIAYYSLVPGRVYLPQVYEAISIMPHDYEEPREQPRVGRVEHFQRLGRIYLRKILRTVLKCKTFQALPSNPAIAAQALMATNQRIYQESHAMYWRLNTFYLPPGPVAHAESYFSSVKPAHKNLIKSLAVQFSIADLTTDILDEVEQVHSSASLYGRDWYILNDRAEGYLWSCRVMNCLWNLWREKLEWIGLWEGLDEVKLEPMGMPPLVLDGATYQDFLRHDLNLPDSFDGFFDAINVVGHERQMMDFVLLADGPVSTELTTMIDNKGWKAFKLEMSKNLADLSA